VQVGEKIPFEGVKNRTLRNRYFTIFSMKTIADRHRLAAIITSRTADELSKGTNIYDFK